MARIPSWIIRWVLAPLCVVAGVLIMAARFSPAAAPAPAPTVPPTIAPTSAPDPVQAYRERLGLHAGAMQAVLDTAADDLRLADLAAFGQDMRQVHALADDWSAVEAPASYADVNRRYLRAMQFYDSMASFAMAGDRVHAAQARAAAEEAMAGALAALRRMDRAR